MIAAVTRISETVDDALSDDDAYALWTSYMRASACTERTIKERRIVFHALGRWLGKRVTLASRPELIAWLGRPDLSAKTRQNYKSFLHTFFTLLQDEGYRADNPAARLPRGHSPRIEANPFTTDDVEKLLNSGIYGKTRMMVALAAYQGFRATEIAAVNGDHIRWETGEIFTSEAKGGFEVWRPLHPKILDLAALDPARFPRTGWWFPGSGPNDGAHINAKSVSNVLSKAVKRAGIAHRPHQLRAWFATELVDAGTDMLIVQQAMRHASPNTLRHYVRPSMVLIAEGMARLPDVSVPSTSTRGTH
ncbi:tyrosine-type recombinase/integrase [Frondihabitans cladoniiphilus]|uniref:Site-specific recombinase XerD n=1 Tax=Frondihabitans cladoniiphilus TaxID=715785 RepID=A0ABP8WC25_9MICO